MTNDNIFQNLKDNWFIILVAVSLTVGWARFEFKLAELDTRVNSLEVQTQSAIASVSEIKENLASIKTTLEFIKETVTKK